MERQRVANSNEREFIQIVSRLSLEQKELLLRLSEQLETATGSERAEALVEVQGILDEGWADVG